jgi:hypothetical protein
MQVNLADPPFPRVALQVLDEAPGGELRAGLPGAVIPGSEGLIFSQDIQPPAALQIVEQSQPDSFVGHLPPLIIALSFAKTSSQRQMPHIGLI